MAFEYGWDIRHIRERLTMAQLIMYSDRMADRLKPWKSTEKSGKFKSFNPWRGKEVTNGG
jgi:hypothetical protein